MSTGVRFAPSPTGQLHVGNLRTAWVSHLLAKTLGEPWVVRFEDIDIPRVVSGAMERQLEDLRGIGLAPDQIRVQTQSHPRHVELFERARNQGQIYPCSCSRKEVQEAVAGMASAPHRAPPAYTGHCRTGGARSSELPTLAWRFKSEDASGKDDFIIGRTSPDGAQFAPAYHWACAIDDFDGKYRWLVRAWDLAEATQAQRSVMQWLARSENQLYSPPSVFHCSLVVQDDGSRLEKRTRGVTLTELLATGWSIDRLLEQFADSFGGFEGLLESGVGGEPDRTLSLGQLGLIQGDLR